MIRIKATVEFDGKVRKCNFESKKIKKITLDELSNIYCFTKRYIGNNSKIDLCYKIVASNGKGNISAIIGGTQVSNSKEIYSVLDKLVEQINIKSKEFNFGGI